MRRARTLIWLLVFCPILLRPADAAAQEDQLQYPLAVAAGGDGTIYLADRHLPGIWRFKDGKLEVFFQGSKRFGTPLNAVRCLALDQDGRLLAGDSATREVYRFDADGKPQPLTKGQVGMPMGLAVKPDGQILVTDLEIHRILAIPAAGGQPQEVAQLPAPTGLALDGSGTLWIVSRAQGALRTLSGDGTLTTRLEGRPFKFPHQVVVAADGTAYVSDGFAKTVWKIAAGGEPEAWVTDDAFDNPVGLSWNRDQSKLLLVDPRAKAVFEISLDGKVARLIPPGS